MQFNDVQVMEPRSSEQLSSQQHSWKPGQVLSAPQSAWQIGHLNNSFSTNRAVKPSSPEAMRTMQPTVFNQQINNSLGFGFGIDDPRRFGIESHLHTDPFSNQLASAHRYNFFDGSGGFLSARRTPVKSVSPEAVDYQNQDVSVLANRQKPSTPFLQSNLDLGRLTDVIPASIFNSPRDLMEPELLLGFQKTKNLELAPKKQRLQPRRGKFQLREKRFKNFVISEILENLPNSKQAVRSRAKKYMKEELPTQAPIKDAIYSQLSPGKESDRPPQEDTIEIPRVQCTRRQTRLKRKLKQCQSSSSSRSRFSGFHHSADQSKDPSKRQTRLSATSKISKLRQRNLVKYQQNKQRYLGFTSPSGMRGANIIEAETVGDIHVGAFERHQARMATADGLWKMEKQHIFSQQQQEPSHQWVSPMRSSQQNRTPPSRGIALLSNQVTEMQMYHEVTGGQPYQHSAALEHEHDSASSEERKLFAIFSGLKVVNMTGTSRVGQATNINFEGEGTAHQADRNDRPYRWSPTLPMSSGINHPRLSSV